MGEPLVSSPRWQRERAAFDAMSDLMAQAEEVRAMFLAAGHEPPAPLLRLLGEAPEGRNGRGDDQGPQIKVPPMSEPPRPAGAGPSWVWVPIKNLLPQTYVLGVLRREKGWSIHARALHEELKGLGFDTTLGSVQNMGTRLEKAGTITRNAEGWSLADTTKAPILHESYGWGPPDLLSAHELAAHRRMFIHHLLSASPDGMQTIQVVKFLRDSQDFRNGRIGNPSKDNIDDDLHVMLKDGKVKRNQRSKKWIAVEE